MTVFVESQESGGVLIKALAVTTATNAHQITPPRWAKGMLMIVNTTVDAASAIITLTMEVGDLEGNYDEVGWGAVATIADVGDTSYLFYPTGQLVAAKEYDGTETINAPIPRDFQLSFTHTDGDAITYGVTVQWLP